MREVENFSNRVKDYFEHLDVPVGGHKKREYPVVDLLEDNTNLYLFVELPGMKKEDIQINLSGERSVGISGTKNPEMVEGSRNVMNERWFGSFHRTVAIPETIEIDSDRVSASYIDGILKITLPKAIGSASRPIEIQ
jgi:HSP20 family protein